MDEEILEQVTEPGDFAYEYPIFDQTNTEITDPNLDLGYLHKEYFTKHHDMVPEVWHYEVREFGFTDGEIYIPTGQSDPHIEIIDDQKGIFKYKNLEGEPERVVCNQTIAPVVDSEMVPAWDETITYYRYILYTEKELSDRKFLAEGPALLAEAQGTIEDLLLVIADLVGGEEEEI